MKEQDRFIGKLVYGWTEKETNINEWHDHFFDIWRPKPKTAKEMYPTWSTSNEWAMRLIADLADRGLEISIINSDVGYKVTIIHSMFQDGGHGKTIPQALTNALKKVDKHTVTAANTISLVKKVLKESYL